MIKIKPLWERLYFDEAYFEVARLVGYQGTTYRAMMQKLEPLEQKLGKQRVHAASYHIVTFEGQMTCNPKPLAEVKLRPEIRKLCFQLLGPPPESEDAFNRNADGSSRRSKPAEPVRETQPNGKPARNESPAKKPRKKKAEPEKSTANNRPATTNSPIMDQYRATKEKHPDMLLVFRVGDFYELFEQDAEEASKLLGLTLTTRDRTIPMTGFPHHALEQHLHHLLRAGKRVAICDLAETGEKAAEREIRHAG